MATPSSRASVRVGLGGRLRVVGGEHDRGPARGLLAQGRDHQLAVGGVEVAGRLVGEQHAPGAGRTPGPGRPAAAGRPRAGRRGGGRTPPGRRVPASPSTRGAALRARARRGPAAGPGCSPRPTGPGVEAVALRDQDDPGSRRALPVRQLDAVDADRAGDRAAPGGGRAPAPTAVTTCPAPEGPVTASIRPPGTSRSSGCTATVLAVGDAEAGRLPGRSSLAPA